MTNPIRYALLNRFSLLSLSVTAAIGAIVIASAIAQEGEAPSAVDKTVDAVAEVVAEPSAEAPLEAPVAPVAPTPPVAQEPAPVAKPVPVVKPITVKPNTVKPLAVQQVPVEAAPVQEPKAEPSYSSPIDWSTLASQSIEAFEPISPAGLEAARTELATRGVAVERRLNPQTSFGQSWLDFLAWSGVQKQFSAGAKLDLAAARKTLNQLSSGTEGVEQPELARFADSLEKFIAVASFARVKDQPKAFKSQVSTLAKLLSTSPLSDARSSFAAERRIALLSDAEKGNSLLSEVKKQYGKANLYVEVSDSLLSQLVARSVSECDPVTDCILGTSIKGTGYTNGWLSISTTESWNNASLNFCMTGNVRSNTRGVNGPVAIYSTGNTSFSVSKKVAISDDAFFTYPANASATTRSTTNSISKIGGGFGSGLIEKIAKKKVNEKRGQADAIAGDHAEDRLEESFDEELGDKIRDARRDYDDNIKKPLRRRRSSPRAVHYMTTNNSLQIQAVQATDKQLAASTSPPSSVAGGSLSARLHQSAINNIMAASLSGATLKKADANEDAVLVGRAKPEWMEGASDNDDEPNEDFRPWTIRFRDGRPVSCVIQPKGIFFTVHAKEIKVGEDTYKNWDLTAKFVPAQVDGEWKLLREGPVDLLPTSFDPKAGKGLPSKQLALRSNLNKAVNEPADRLPMEIDINSIDLSDKDTQIDELMMQAFELSEGWLSAGWLAN